MKRYIAMPGRFRSNREAEAVGIELEALAAEHGAIKPVIVVDAARPESSPLHKHFEWDDTKAAEKHRLQQASELICSVRIIEDDKPAEKQPILRAFVHVKAGESETGFKGMAFIPLTKAENNSEYQQQLLESARSELRSWKRKYEDLSEHFGSIIADVLHL